MLGATGMVGQRFVALLEKHPWFRVTEVAASPKSAGQPYRDAVAGRWVLSEPLPSRVGELVVFDASNVEAVASRVDFVFCAVDMTKDETRALEDAYAKAETPVISNNSAHRATPDVPMMVPEINAEHAELVVAQRRRRGTRRGFVAVKPNCSLQSHAENRGFSGAVGTDEPDLLSAVERARRLEEEDLLAVLFGDRVETNHEGAAF